jgi:hypothetical protein
MSDNASTPEPPLPAFTPGMRASDADRERVAAELRDHAVAGRLDTEEFEQRLSQAYAARTTDELQALRRDLPATPEQLALAHRERRSRLVRRTVQETGGSLGAFAICTVIWVVSGASGFFWPLFVAIGVIGLLVRNSWDLYGPSADLDAAEARLRDRRDRKLNDGDRHAQPSARQLEQHQRHSEHRADRDARRRERRDGRRDR